jgi:chitinase
MLTSKLFPKITSLSLYNSTDVSTRWHLSRPTKADDREGITHIIVAFAFANKIASFNDTLLDVYRTEFPDAQLMIAVGGWGGNENAFKDMSKTDAGIKAFADEIGDLVDRTGADGIGM